MEYPGPSLPRREPSIRSPPDLLPIQTPGRGPGEVNATPPRWTVLAHLGQPSLEGSRVPCPAFCATDYPSTKPHHTRKYVRLADVPDLVYQENMGAGYVPERLEDNPCRGQCGKRETVCFGRNSRPTRWGGRAGPVELDDTDHVGRCKMGNSQEGRAGGPKGAILAAAPPNISLSQQTRAAGCVREGPVAQSAASCRGSHRRERDHLSLQRGARFKVTLTRYPDMIVSGRDGAN